MMRASSFSLAFALLLGFGSIVTGCDEAPSAKPTPAAESAPAKAKPEAPKGKEAPADPQPEVTPCSEVLTRKAFDDMYWHFGRLGKGKIPEKDQERVNAAIRKAVPMVEDLDERFGEAPELGIACDTGEKFRAMETELRTLSTELLGER